MVWKMLVNMQNFKSMAFLLLEILRHKVTPLQKGTSRRDSIFTPWNRPKFEKKSPFIPENIFSGPALYFPMHFPGFQAKQKNSYVQFLEMSHLKNNCSLRLRQPLVN